jgi:hypothetical protein
MTENMADYLSFMDPPPAPDVPGPLVEAEPYPDEIPPPKVNVFDLATVKRDLAPYAAQISALVAIAEAHQITNEPSLKLAVEYGSQAKRLATHVEKARKATVEEPNRYVKDVNNLAKTFTDPLGKIEAGLKRKISDYQARQELERRKAEEAARLAREEAQKRIDEEAEKAGVEAPQLPDVVVPEPQRVTRTEEGSAFQRKDWTYDVEDETLVPREYLLIDSIKVRNAIRMGCRAIPGLKIYEKAATVFRA